MSLIYARTEFVRRSRDIGNLFFILVLPVVLYLVFGPSTEQPGSFEHGNVVFYLMVSMALYGAATAMTSLTGSAATEIAQGWGRQLALSPLTPARFIGTKILIAALFAGISTAVVFTVGALTGAEADGLWRWLASAAIVLAGSSVFGLYGLAVGLLFRSDSALGVASGLLTVFAFFGNVFMPLGGTMLDVARFTPMYGVVGLARWPLLEGEVVGVEQADGLLPLLLNVLAWTAVFAAIVALSMRRSRARR